MSCEKPVDVVRPEVSDPGSETLQSRPANLFSVSTSNKDQSGPVSGHYRSESIVARLHLDSYGALETNNCPARVFLLLYKF